MVGWGPHFPMPRNSPMAGPPKTNTNRQGWFFECYYSTLVAIVDVKKENEGEREGDDDDDDDSDDDVFVVQKGDKNTQSNKSKKRKSTRTEGNRSTKSSKSESGKSSKEQQNNILKYELN